MLFGNAAKWRILGEIPDGSTVLDFGAGTGDGSIKLTQNRPNCEVFAFEPDPVSKEKLCKRLSFPNVVDCLNNPTFSAKFDRILSFSVFEHVFDRIEYLSTAHRCLAQDGIFYLNYDDGHFRHWIDVGDVATWSSAISSLAARALAPVMVRLGRPHHYLKRVSDDDIKRLVIECGFEVIDDRYENIESMKDASKSVPENERSVFMDKWVALEDYLNQVLRKEALQMLFLSRTLTLKRSSI